jgi:hypothetical protein
MQPSCPYRRLTEQSKTKRFFFAFVLSITIFSFPETRDVKSSAALAWHAYIKPFSGQIITTNNITEKGDASIPETPYVSPLDKETSLSTIYNQWFQPPTGGEDYWCQIITSTGETQVSIHKI